MKPRKPLKRKKGLQPGPPPQRKTELKRTEFKRKISSEDRKLNEVRKKWKAKFKRCMICNRRTPRTCHEIVGGRWRFATKKIPAFWLATCDGLFGCHALIQNSPDWPAERQLAHKLVHDPKGFDLLEFNATLTDMLDIEMAAVDAWVEKLK